MHTHGLWIHEHHHHGPHRHLRLPFRSTGTEVHDYSHGHSQGLVDPSIVRSRDGVRAVEMSFGVLAITAGLQLAVFLASGSVALLADLIHNAGDALTAVPLAIAFVLRSRRGERWAGYAIVSVVFASAVLAGVEAFRRLAHPPSLQYLAALAAVGAIGFAGNELAARIRLRAGARLNSSALVADGHHARVDGYVSLGVIVSAASGAAGRDRIDPIVG